jgi:hypothetical protein
MESRTDSACILVLASLWSACSSAQPPAPLPPSPSSSSSLADGCKPWECGSNGPWLGGNIVFHELAADGTPNDVGLKLDDFRSSSNVHLTLDVQGDELIGRTGSVELRRQGLVGAVLTLSRAAVQGSREVWELTIKEVSKTELWVDPVSQTSVPVYHFTYQQLGTGSPKDTPDLCQPPKELDPRWSSLGGMALIFRGDRYDAATKTVTEVGGHTPWFNIACAGTTVAKMHLLRHTWAGSDPQHTTTVDQRQAVLKMLTGDYCGSGDSFTVNGHPLLYTYAKPWQPVQPSPIDWTSVATIDAVWDQTGAVCMNVPRMVDEQPNIPHWIIHKCQSLSSPHTITPCGTQLKQDLQTAPSGTPLWTQLHGYAISANQ